MSQASTNPPIPMRWRVLRGLRAVLRALVFIALCIAPLVVVIWQLIVSIVSVVTGSLSMLDVVPSFFGSVSGYWTLIGLVFFFALLIPLALIEGLLPPAYLPPRSQESHLNSLPQEAQANEEHMLAAPVLCPAPQCRAWLDLRAGVRLYLHPQTGKQINPNAAYAANISIPGMLLAALLCFGTSGLVRVGHIDQNPVGKILVSLGTLAGVAVWIASFVIASRVHKAALARADPAVSCQCPRCGLWWMFKLDGPPQTVAGEPRPEEGDGSC